MVQALYLPSLASQRLQLVPLSDAHSGGMFAMWSRPEVCRFAGPVADFEGRPIPLPALHPSVSDKIIEFFVRRAAQGTALRWALLSKPDSMFVGAVGFNSLGSCPEIAYHLNPAFWGRGLMTEAAETAIEWVRDRPGSNTVEAFIDAENFTSIKLAERLGMSRTGNAVDGADRYSMALRHG